MQQTMAAHGSGPAGSDAKFKYLADQRTNYCNLDPATVALYSAKRRMQGSCCDRMNRESYRRQVIGLQKYAAILEVPTDPYDIQAGQAKRLLGYDHSISLTGREETMFDAAMRTTDEHAPCCCQCWRWYMIEGLDKFLIRNRNLSARQVAEITGLVDGCGGPAGRSPRAPGMAPMHS